MPYDSTKGSCNEEAHWQKVTNLETTSVKVSTGIRNQKIVIRTIYYWVEVRRWVAVIPFKNRSLPYVKYVQLLATNPLFCYSCHKPLYMSWILLTTVQGETTPRNELMWYFNSTIHIRVWQKYSNLMNILQLPWLVSWPVWLLSLANNTSSLGSANLFWWWGSFQ